LLRIELVRNINRTADAETLDVVTVGRLGQPRSIQEKVIGVELLMPMGPPTGPVKFLRAAFCDGADQAAPAATEFSLIVGGQHFYFGDRVHVGLVVHGDAP